MRRSFADTRMTRHDLKGGSAIIWHVPAVGTVSTQLETVKYTSSLRVCSRRNVEALDLSLTSSSWTSWIQEITCLSVSIICSPLRMPGILWFGVGVGAHSSTLSY